MKNKVFAAEVVWTYNDGTEVQGMDILFDAMTKLYFLPLYNEAIEALNPNYERWNAEFFAKHPELDGWSREYNQYIADKSNEILYGFEKGRMTLRCEIIEGDLCEVVGHYDIRNGPKSYRCRIRITEDGTGS